MSWGSANSRSNVLVGAGCHLVAIENRLTVFVDGGSWIGSTTIRQGELILLVRQL